MSPFERYCGSAAPGAISGGSAAVAIAASTLEGIKAPLPRGYLGVVGAPLPGRSDREAI